MIWKGATEVAPSGDRVDSEQYHLRRKRYQADEALDSLGQNF